MLSVDLRSFSVFSWVFLYSPVIFGVFLCSKVIFCFSEILVFFCDSLCFAVFCLCVCFLYCVFLNFRVYLCDLCFFQVFLSFLCWLFILCFLYFSVFVCFALCSPVVLNIILCSRALPCVLLSYPLVSVVFYVYYKVLLSPRPPSSLFFLLYYLCSNVLRCPLLSLYVNFMFLFVVFCFPVFFTVLSCPVRACLPMFAYLTRMCIYVPMNLTHSNGWRAFPRQHPGRNSKIFRMNLQQGGERLFADKISHALQVVRLGLMDQNVVVMPSIILKKLARQFHFASSGKI
jgi:hypothetical protein